MTNTPYERAIIAGAALDFIPPLIRKSLLSDRRFVEKYGFRTKATIALGSSGVIVQRSELFNAVRAALSEEGLTQLVDDKGKIWSLVNDAPRGELAKLVLLSDQHKLAIPELCVLSEDTSTRITSLEKSASDVNLPLNSKEKWQNILEERALKDDEVDTYHSDIRDTPVYVAQTIQSEIRIGEISVSSLVPNSRRYFERLIGAYDGSDSIRDFAVRVARETFRNLVDWRPCEGFLFSLLLSSHSALTAEINVDRLDKEDLEKALCFLEDHGDMVSRLGALEVGLRILPDRPEIEPFLLRLIHLIRDDEAEDEASEFKLFSALFILVDGELARTRLLAEEPPFYRRLASLAQAGLIHRQITQCGIDYRRFSDWAINNRSEYFYMQTFADMRVEPLWNPDLVAASQLQGDYFGRIMIAGNYFQSNLSDGELRRIILGDEAQSLIKLCEFPRQYFPGPLEGGEDSPNTLPDDLASVIEEQLDGDEVEAASFIALVNSAMIFRLTSGHADLAAKALRLGNYTLANLADRSELMAILNGLATVAAVSRSSTLANELRILVRRYRRDSQYSFPIAEAMRVCLVSSAALEDLTEWRVFAGEWLTELAFSHLEGNEGEVLHSYILTLLHSVPELWVSCAKADAALQAWCSR